MRAAGSRIAKSPRSPAGAGLAALCAFVVVFFVLLVPHSFASEHTVISGEYGKEGPASSGIGEGCRLAYDSATNHLYLDSDQKIYGLSISPGSATPLGGKFPISTGIRSECGEPDIEVDHSGNGNLYATPSSPHEIRGWSSSGDPLGSPWPVSAGEVCGLTATATGEVWGGNYSDADVVKYNASGTEVGTITVGFKFCKLAVDRSTGDLYVAPYSSGEPIVKFTASSGYATQVSFPSAGDNEPGLAINGAEDKLYVGNGSSTVKVYNTETGGLVETIDLGETGGYGIAVDENTDTLFVTVGSGSTGVIREYLGIETPKATTGEPIGNSEVSGTANPNGVGPITECYFEYGLTTSYGSKQNCAQSTPISSEESVSANLPGLTGEETYHYRLVLTNGEPHVVGRGADKTIVPHNVKGLTTEAPFEVTATSAILNASFEGTNEDTHYYFEWGQSLRYGHQTAAPPGEDAGTTTGPTHISSKISGLKPGVLYHYRVVAENSIGVSKATDKTFSTYELPSIESFTSKNVTASSAEIDAIINPHGFETSYFVEYGPTLEYGSIAPVPSGTLAAGNTAQSVAIQLSGLEGVVYHFRVIAESQWGPTRTNDQTFTFYPPPCPNAVVRQQTSSQYLPDCRAYELVSPEEAGGVTLVNAPWAPSPYATSPARFAFGGFLGAVTGTEGTNSITADTYVSTRTSTGWETHYVGVPGSQVLGVSTPTPNLDFSRFLDFKEGEGFAGVSQPPDKIPYIWNYENEFLGRWPANFASIPDSEATEGAWQPSPDFSHLAFSSNSVAFTHGVGEEGLEVAPGSAYDYDTESGTTKLISVTGAGDPIPQEPGNVESTGEYILFPGVDPIYGEPAAIDPGVSTDGSHILMSTSSGPYGTFTHPLPPTRLYMRVNDAVTYEVSEGHDVHYVGMSADGTKVYFTSPERLTAEDTDNSVDLYMWSEAKKGLTLVSSGPEGIGDSGNSDECEASWTSGCNIVPVKTTASTDNSIASESGDVYFYSPEQLEGQKGVPNRENLYVYRNGRPQFVASMNPTAPATEGEGPNGPISRIQVSPNGAHAAFITSSKLTSYENAGYEEMYSYEPGAEKILCSSCKPNGEPPEANVTGSKAGLFMSNDGRTFFETTDPLVSQDTNEEEDVYEFVEGRPQLITTGTGTNGISTAGEGGSGNIGEEGLSGVSADGVNVYFAARDELVAQDKNGPFLVFYDARTGGGFPYEPPLAPCEAADECHGEGSWPSATPNVASESDLGSRGNAPNPAKHKAKKKSHKAKKKHKAKSKRPGKRNLGAKHHRPGSHRHA